MVTLRSAVGSGKLAPAGKRLVAESMYQKGKSFLGAAFLLQEKSGHEYVALHLLCHGVENVLKGLLLLKDYDKHMPKLKRIGHNLEKLAGAAQREFALRPLQPNLQKELGHLSRLYSNHLLRYGNFRDILVDATTIQSDQLWRRMLVVLRLAERHLRRHGRASTVVMMLAFSFLVGSAAAAGGWYLLLPPMDLNARVNFNSDAPLSSWQHFGSFDSAGECEARKKMKADEDYQWWVVARQKDPSLWDATLPKKFHQFAMGRCMASDDPRLKK